jgi:hypothetical protein
VVGGWWLAVGGWWLVVGGWWLVVGGWWLVAGGCVELAKLIDVDKKLSEKHNCNTRIFTIILFNHCTTENE